MSETQSGSDGYRRDNFWGEEADDDPAAEPADRADPNNPNELIAHKLLRDTATMLCKTTLLEEPWNGGRLAEAIALVFDDNPDFDGRGQVMHHRNEPVELTDPVVRPPTPTARDQRHRKRLNSESGYISGGHSTGVLVQDRSLEEFMSVVQLWLEGRRTDIRESEKRQARQLAARLKQQGELRDVDVLAKVVGSVRD